MEPKRFMTDFAGTPLIIETGRMAKQAGFSVTVQMGETVVLATATMSMKPREGIDFFPLMVDYEERFYAGGRIKGAKYSKREGKPSQEAVLTGRFIDRGMRPLFPQNMMNDVQIILTPLCLDGVNKPDVVAMIGACTAVHCSAIPFDGPVAGIRVGRIDGELTVNTTLQDQARSDLELLVIGDSHRITMVDCGAKNVPDQAMVDAFAKAMEAMGPIAAFIDEIRKAVGVPKMETSKLTFNDSFKPEEQKMINELKSFMLPHLDKFLFNKPQGSKGERKAILEGLKDMARAEYVPKLVAKGKTQDEAEAQFKKLLGKFFYNFVEEHVTKAILDKNLRVDGRRIDQIRPLSADVSILPRTHGSGLFERGETQILSIVTLGGPGDELSVESMEDDEKKRYFHHYNFAPFSVGEVGSLRGAGRREIGHGALAEKALQPVLPQEVEFPYTVRVVSEVLGSNGSSSMGSTCGSTLALMDAGVPISKHVGGIAMGLASDGKRWKVITDLQDMEDGTGGMDFKITGTRDGVTAIQMDTKTPGLDMEIIRIAMSQGRQALGEILTLLETAIPEPRAEVSKYAPRIISFFIDPEKIGEVIGPGGKKIREITETTGVQIDIEDSGQVCITSTIAENALKAEKMIKDIARVIKVGDIFENAVVVRLMNFGAFIKLTPSTDGLLHISEVDHKHVERIEDRFKLGDKVTVKVIKIEMGKVNVSVKALTPRPADLPPEPDRPPRREYGDRDRRGPPRRDGDGGRGPPRGGDRRYDRPPPSDRDRRPPQQSSEPQEERF